mgnify:CR=1 FL=1
MQSTPANKKYSSTLNHRPAHDEPDIVVAHAAPSNIAETASCGGFTDLADDTPFELLRPVLAVTYWFEPGAQTEPYPLTIRFTGRRTDVLGQLQPGDRFIHDETIDRVVPGSGPLALTAKIRDISPGEWVVTSEVVGAPVPGRPTRALRKLLRQREQERAIPVVENNPLPPVLRLWRRWAPLAYASTSESATPSAHTCRLPFARTPGILPGAWAIMVAFGVIAALTIQTLVLAHHQVRLGSLWLVWLAIILVGGLGAKLWFMADHRSLRAWDGWCIQGFVTGATLAAAITLVTLRIPVGVFLDAVAPGVLAGMAIGRIGCFFAGCCGGPPTTAWWGVWSSDQRVGARRVPTQLMESLLAAVLGVIALAVVWAREPASGAVFVGGLAAYTLGRQGILFLRAEPRKTRLGLPIMVGLSALVLIAAIMYGIVLTR